MPGRCPGHSRLCNNFKRGSGLVTRSNLASSGHSEIFKASVQQLLLRSTLDGLEGRPFHKFRRFSIPTPLHDFVKGSKRLRNHEHKE